MKKTNRAMGDIGCWTNNGGKPLYECQDSYKEPKDTGSVKSNKPKKDTKKGKK